MSKTLKKVIRPLVECPISLRKQRKLFRELYATAVSNAPQNEFDNFTAKKFTPFFLAMSEVLDNICRHKPKSKTKQT